MKIKICGVTNLDDALAAIDAGADCLGFNFYLHSPRYLSPAECARIHSAFSIQHSAIQTIGIFVNAPITFITETLDACGLDLAQLSGDEPPEMLAELRGRAYKAIRPRALEEAEHEASRYTPFASGQPALLVDASHPKLYGGTGQTADWSLARNLARTYTVLLAGGLRPDNVAEAMRAVEPWGVDVASGVESAPGKKDRRKMIEFVRAARRAVAQLA
ncbi:MAG TPA: phosphoribosylanthranilate isomerase [Anaerolineae bacterium]|nr:phosphoribosylanthranilate isomerase [Anaerolineae bacterium]